MSMIDRQRIAAVKAMEALGYTFDGVGWTGSAGSSVLPVQDEADAMHTLLVLRADKLEGCIEGDDDEAELKIIAEAVGDYEAKHWPDGVVPRGKG